MELIEKKTVKRQFVLTSINIDSGGHGCCCCAVGREVVANGVSDVDETW